MSGAEQMSEKADDMTPSENEGIDQRAIQVATGEDVSDAATDPIDEILIQQTIAFLNETVRKTLYKGYLEMGKYLFEKFFDGDIDQVRSTNPKKNASFRKLKSHHDLPVHPSTLHGMVRVAVQEIFFAEHHVDTSKVLYTHLCALVKLPDNEEKIQLVQRIISEKLPSRQLEDIVRARRKELRGAKTGEPEVLLPLSSLVKDLKGLFDPKMTKRLDADLKELQPEERDELKESISKYLTNLQKFTRICKTRLGEIESLEAEEKQNK